MKSFSLEQCCDNSFVFPKKSRSRNAPSSLFFCHFSYLVFGTFSSSFPTHKQSIFRLVRKEVRLPEDVERLTKRMKTYISETEVEVNFVRIIFLPRDSLGDILGEKLWFRFHVMLYLKGVSHCISRLCCLLVIYTSRISLLVTDTESEQALICKLYINRSQLKAESGY